MGEAVFIKNNLFSTGLSISFAAILYLFINPRSIQAVCSALFAETRKNGELNAFYT